jgi:kynurenine formamidase
MSSRIIDLSVAIDAAVVADPPMMQPQLRYFSHRETAGQVASFFPGLTQEDLPGGEGWAIEQVQLTTHNGTHLDAPWHFASTMNRGERAWTIDEVPLDWCIGPGVKLDFRHLLDGHVATAAEVAAELDRIGHALQPRDIVVVNTRAGAAYSTPGYLEAGCGMGREATLHLLERGVRVTGTDAWSWDAPFAATARRWLASRDPSIVWEGHRASREIGYCHIEKLCNLEELPPTGFEIICLPVKIKAASAGWARVVARLPAPG